MAENGWAKFGEVGSKLGEALMQIAMMTENRKYRAAMLARQGTFDQMALDRIEMDRERLVQNAIQTNATWLAQGWSGTPGSRTWTEEPAFDPTARPVGAASADLGGGLFDRQPAMGGDPSQFGAELMQTPQLGGGFTPGRFEDASYDPYRSEAFQESEMLYDRAQQRGEANLAAGRQWSGAPQPDPTYGVSGGVPSAQGLRTPGAAEAFAAANQPDPSFGINPEGRVTMTGGSSFDEVLEMLDRIGAPPGLDVEQASSLRGEFAADPIVRDAQAVMMSYAKLREVALAEPTGANDLSIIFSFMKMLDPGSVVRESEFANAQNAQGVPQRVRAVWNQAQQGTRLTPQTRSEFLRSAEGLLDGQRQALLPVMLRFEGLAQRGGHLPENVLYDPLEGAGTGGAPVIRIVDRMDELLAENPDMTDDEIYEQLRSEGYMDLIPGAGP